MNSDNLVCSLEFTVETVTCPRAWLLPFPRPYVCISIQVFDQRVATRNVLPIFPLRFYEKFCVTKEYAHWSDFRNILNILADERIQIILAQITNHGISIRLATFQSNLLDFVFHDSTTLPAYSEIKREIILTPVSKYFKGIIGPRLHLSINALIENFGASSIPLVIQNNTYGIRPRFERNFYGNQTSKNIPENHQLDPMEDRPPFVVRRVDSKLIGRIPSLYKKFEFKRAYCCYSPHRDGQCAACRMVDGDFFPTRCSIQRPYTAGNEKHHKSKLSPESQCMPYQQNKTKSQLENDAPKPIERKVVPSPEIVRAGQDRVLPNSDPPSPRVNMWTDRREAWLAAGHPRSPLFNRPTYNERFGDLALDSGRKDDFYAKKQSNLLTHLDQAQQTDYFYPINAVDDKIIRPYTDTCRPECCTCHSSYYNNYCSCPYCPTYWRSRFDSPLHTSRRYWRDFHNGLSCIYDDFHHFHKIRQN